MTRSLLTNAAGEAATGRPRRFRFHRPPRDRVQTRGVGNASGRSFRSSGRRKVRAIPDARLLRDLQPTATTARLTDHHRTTTPSYPWLGLPFHVTQPLLEYRLHRVHSWRHTIDTGRVFKRVHAIQRWIYPGGRGNCFRGWGHGLRLRLVRDGGR